MIYSGNHAKPRRRSNGKPLMLLVALVLVVALSIGGTLAWLSATTTPVTNTFIPGDASVQLVEAFSNDGKGKTSAKIENLGNIDVYVRVAVVINAVDGEGNIIAPSGNLPALSLGTGWQELGGYYYYTSKVSVGGFTSNLLGADLSLDGYEVNIIAQSIQSDGTDGTNSAVKAAWGVSLSGTTWAA